MLDIVSPLRHLIGRSMGPMVGQEECFGKVMVHKICDCQDILYLPSFLKDSKDSFTQLEQAISFKQNKIKVFGKAHFTPRLEAWFGDYAYRYSGNTLIPGQWPFELLRIKNKLEQSLGACFNSCLVNYYRDGSDYVSWHRDNEAELGDEPVIASVSLGQTRRFVIRRYPSRVDRQVFDLNCGDVIVMQGHFQRDWEHQLVKTSRKVGPRINLTYRWVHPAS